MLGPSWYPTTPCQGKNSFVPNSCHVMWAFNAFLGLGLSTQITMDNCVCVLLVFFLGGGPPEKELIRHHIYY